MRGGEAPHRATSPTPQSLRHPGLDPGSARRSGRDGDPGSPLRCGRDDGEGVDRFSAGPTPAKCGPAARSRKGAAQRNLVRDPAQKCAAQRLVTALRQNGSALRAEVLALDPGHPSAPLQGSGDVPRSGTLGFRGRAAERHFGFPGTCRERHFGIPGTCRGEALWAQPSAFSGSRYRLSAALRPG